MRTLTNRSGLAFGLDVVAAAAMASGHNSVAVCLFAATLHAGAVLVVGTGGVVSHSHRVQAVALTLTLPVVGSLVALLVSNIHGKGELAQFFRAQPAVARSINVVDISRLITDVSACEALVSQDSAERSAALALIVRRPDAAHLRLLRWAIARAHPESAIESALVLEDLHTQFEQRIVTLRAQRLSTPGFDSALAAADHLADAIHTGLADDCMVGVLSQEAATCYQQAAGFAPERVCEFALRQAVFARPVEVHAA